MATSSYDLNNYKILNGPITNPYIFTENINDETLGPVQRYYQVFQTNDENLDTYCGSILHMYKYAD